MDSLHATIAELSVTNNSVIILEFPDWKGNHVPTLDSLRVCL